MFFVVPLKCDKLHNIVNIIESIILGIVQGLTEFLPVSSSGHLVLVGKLLKLPNQQDIQFIRFVVIVHLGTLAAVICIYRTQVRRLLKGIFRGRIRLQNGKWKFQNPDTKMVCLLALATIPAVLVGVLFNNMIKGAFGNPLAAGVCLAVTGLVLFFLRFKKPEQEKVTSPRALIIGIAQAVAILPGMSRSGLTISAGIYSGVERTRAAEFSFLLSIPVILGAGLMEFRETASTGLAWTEGISLAAGGLAAAISGYLAIRFLLNVIKKGRLHYFAYYCWLVALIVIICYV